jgi:hypothetical protein
MIKNLKKIIGKSSFEDKGDLAMKFRKFINRTSAVIFFAAALMLLPAWALAQTETPAQQEPSKTNEQTAAETQPEEKDSFLDSVGQTLKNTTEKVQGTVKNLWNEAVGLFSSSEKDEKKNAETSDAADRQLVSKGVADAWEDLTDILDKASRIREKMPELPESSYWGENKKTAGRKMDELLRNARTILLSSESVERLHQMDENRKEIARLNADIELNKNRRISAPEKSLNPLEKTTKDCDEAIAEDEARIKKLNAAQEDARAAILNELRSWGMNLTDSQAEVLFSSVTGGTFIENAAVFENVKGVTEQLAELTRQNSGSIEMARRYYGMYVTLMDVLLETQREFTEKIDSEWKPQIEKISAEASASLAEAQKAMYAGRFTSEQKAIFRSNIDSNRMTVDAAGQYLKYLDSQKKSIKQCMDSISRDREVAMNTYATVQHINDIYSVIHSGLNLFSALESMQMPEFQPFDSTAVKKEFSEITRRLQSRK